MQVTFCLLDASYFLDDEGNPVITLWGVDRKGKTIVLEDRKFRPYFYVEPKRGLTPDETKALRASLAGLETETRSPEKAEIVTRRMFGKPRKFVKVTVTRPSDVPEFRRLALEMSDVGNTYEYDIPFYMRYLTDKKLNPLEWLQARGIVSARGRLNADLVLNTESINQTSEGRYPDLNVLAFDIEVMEEDNEEKIIMISLKSRKGLEKVITYREAEGAERVADEKALLRRFMHIVSEEDPHVLCGYNTDGFDFPRLRERCRRHGLELVLGKDGKPVEFMRRGRATAAKMTGRAHIDLYGFVSNILSQSLTSEVLTLDRVAREMLGKGKKDMSLREMEHIWHSGKNMEKLVDYSRHDAGLALMLAEHLLPQMYEICRMTGQTLFDVPRMSYSQLVEGVLIRKAFRIGEIVYNRPTYRELQIRKRTPAYEGGYVRMPKEGIHENIALFDFMSLYPTIIVSHNVSPETLNCSHEDCMKNRPPGSPHHFCTKRKGFIPAIVGEIIRRRREVKKKMQKATGQEKLLLRNQQFALKILANASYGYYGYAGSRWYSRVAATCITAWGRHYIKSMIDMAEDMGLDVLYSDTDSLFLRMKTKKSAKDFMKRVNAELPGIMELEFKGIYRRGIFIEAKTGFAAKKKYALLDADGNLIIRGMETRRRDWSGIAKKTQEKVLAAVLKDRSPEKAVRTVRRIVREIRKGGIDINELVIFTQLKKPLNKYEQMGPHVKAAKKAILRGRRIRQGSVIGYVITKGKGTISDRAEPAEDAENYDPVYYIEHQVLPAAMRVLSGLGIGEQQLIPPMKKKETLKGFFRKR